MQSGTGRSCLRLLYLLAESFLVVDGIIFMIEDGTLKAAARHRQRDIEPCGLYEYYDVVVSRCSLCADVCSSEIDQHFCIRNCPDYYRKMQIVHKLDDRSKTELPLAVSYYHSTAKSSSSASGRHSSVTEKRFINMPLFWTSIISMFLAIVASVILAVICVVRRRKQLSARRRGSGGRPPQSPTTDGSHYLVCDDKHHWRKNDDRDGESGTQSMWPRLQPNSYSSDRSPKQNDQKQTVSTDDTKDINTYFGSDSLTAGQPSKLPTNSPVKPQCQTLRSSTEEMMFWKQLNTRRDSQAVCLLHSSVESYTPVKQLTARTGIQESRFKSYKRSFYNWLNKEDVLRTPGARVKENYHVPSKRLTSVTQR